MSVFGTFNNNSYLCCIISNQLNPFNNEETYYYCNFGYAGNGCDGAGQISVSGYEVDEQRTCRELIESADS